MDLKEKLKNLPSSPGVYLMKDSLDNIIYVGKSKNLKNRVQSYFYKSKSHSPKVEKLVKNLKSFEYILTDTEFEAFMLECKLIKELKPMYNRMMKSPLSYTYIRIQTNVQYHKIEVVIDSYENDNNLYFGPYTKKSTVEKTVQGIKEFYKINCSNPSKKGNTCLNYSLGLCIGMCLGGSKLEHYNDIISKIIDLLNGTNRIILEEMEQQMLSASEKFDFETAAKLRDFISAINFLINKEKIIKFTELNQYIIMVEHLNDCTIKFFLIRRNQILFSCKYNLEEFNIQELKEMIKADISIYFKAVSNYSPIKINKYEIDEAEIIYSYLKSSSCNYIVIPEESSNFKNILNLNEALNKLLPSDI